MVAKPFWIPLQENASAMNYRLTSKQKWQLALSLVAIYYPILIYINVPTFYRNWNTILYGLPFFLAECLVILLFYFLWIGLAEWIQNRLLNQFGEDFLLEAKLPAQLVTLVISIGLAVAFIIVHHKLMHGVFHLLDYVWPERGRPPRKNNGPEFDALWQRANQGFYLMLMLSAFYLTANRRVSERMKEIQVKTERLEKESLQAQFAALKTQINPHFLFNSLSILSSLVQIDADLSEKFIDQLSKAYRYILEQKNNELVPLKTELDFIQSYVFLLKIRFEEKFDVFIDISESYRTRYNIAPLTLQLLVENAVKHNRMSSKEPLRVHILVENDDLVVRNGLQTRTQTDASTGIGLRNIINRYGLLTDRRVWVGEEHGSFVIRIPLLS